QKRVPDHTYTTIVPSLFLMLRLRPRSSLFPYTTLFRSMTGSELIYDLVATKSLYDTAYWFLATDEHGRPAIYPFPPSWVTPVRKDRKSTRLNSSHVKISYAVFCLKKKTVR